MEDKNSPSLHAQEYLRYYRLGYLGIPPLTKSLLYAVAIGPVIILPRNDLSTLAVRSPLTPTVITWPGPMKDHLFHWTTGPQRSAFPRNPSNRLRVRGSSGSRIGGWIIPMPELPGYLTKEVLGDLRLASSTPLLFYYKNQNRSYLNDLERCLISLRARLPSCRIR